MPDTMRQAKSGAWIAYVLGAFTVIAPQLLGGATTGTQLAITLAGAGVALVCAYGVTPGSSGITPVAALSAAAAVTWTLIQALPIPCALSAWAQPERASLSAALLELGAIDAPRCSLTLSPGSTWAALSLAGVVLALVLSATVVARAGHRQVLLVAIAASSIAMAGVALAHAIMDASSVFGVYTPKYARPQVLLAPLMNENHLAGHITLGFPLCLAFARRSERIDGRILWWTAAFITFSCGLLTLSRGGAAALILSGCAYAVLDLRSARARRGNSKTLPVVVATLACMALGAYFSVDLLAKQFAPHEGAFEKLNTAMKVGSLAWIHPWAGIGRGALGDVSTHVFLRNQRLSFAENLPIHWLVEWGIPATLVIGGGFCYALSKLRFEQRAEKALACGFFALILQNLVDFSLELAGVACVAAVALGVLVSREEPSPRLATLTARLPARPALIGAAWAALVCTALATPWLGARSRGSLHAAVLDGLKSGAPSEQLHATLQTGFNGYPLDPFFLILRAAVAVREAAPSTVRWLNLAFDAAPGWAEPHVQAAVYLENHGQLDQAAIELGLAIELDPRQQSAALEFLRRHPLAELVWVTTPLNATSEQARRESMVDCLLQLQLWAEADKALLQLLDRFPRSEYARLRLVMTARKLGQRELALDRAWAMYRALPPTPATVAALADVLARDDKRTEALRIIDSAPREIRQSAEVLSVEASTAALIPDERRLDVALTQLLNRHGTNTQARAGFLKFASEQLTVVGNHHAALARAQSAYDMSGDPAALELAHQAAVRAGVLSAALRTAAELCNVGHRGKAFCGQQPLHGSSP